MAEPLAPHLRLGDFDTALVANHPAVFHAFVFPAETLPICYRAEDARTEQAITLRLERTVVDGLRLRHFTMRPLANLFGRGQRNTNSLEIRCELRFFLLESKHFSSPVALFHYRFLFLSSV